MAQPRPSARAIAVVAGRLPPWLPAGGTPDAHWCPTMAEAAVLARSGRIRAVVVDHVLVGPDADLVATTAGCCPVLVTGRSRVIDGTVPGAVVLDAPPHDLEDLRRAVAQIEAAPDEGPPAERASPVVAVAGAPGADGPGAATALAADLARRRARPALRVVLADLSLDAPLRARHGLGTDDAGLLELVHAARFAPPPPELVATALHPVGAGYRLLPGLHRHRDWVSVGRRSAEGTLSALRQAGDLVVAYVDGDVEGDQETGSFDVEDRNILARCTVQAARVVVVIGREPADADVGAAAMADDLAAFAGRRPAVLVVGRDGRRRLRPAGRRRWGGRTALADLVVSHLAAADEPAHPGAGPARIRPGTLGHWGQDVEGWITPRTPQHP